MGTEQAAAHGVERVKVSRRLDRKILDILESGPKTTTEITDELMAKGELGEHNKGYVSTRVTELRHLGLLEARGLKRAPGMKRAETLWGKLDGSIYEVVEEDAEAPKKKEAAAEACEIFTCKRRWGNYCCHECDLRDRCANPCLNHPDRCGKHMGGEIRCTSTK